MQRAARLGAAVASGALLAAARPPLDLGPLACVALVPLFLAWRDRRPRAAAGYAFLAGVTYHGLSISWVWYFGVVATIGLVGALAFYWALTGWVVAWLATRRMGAPWLTAAVWVCAEGLAARMPLEGFSWNEVGYAFHDIPPARALASAGGVALVSFLAVALNALLADVVVACRQRGRHVQVRPALVRAGAGIAVVVLATGVLTATRAEPTPSGSLRVAVLQGNDLNRELTVAEERAEYLPNSHLGLASEVGDDVDLIIFPESSMNNGRTNDLARDRRLARVAREHRAWVLANASVAASTSTATRDRDPDHNANLNVLLRPNGTLAGAYAKRHLVPFGEYVYFPGLVEGLVPSVRDQVPYDFERGARPGVFDMGDHRIATVICFESAFGHEVRPVVRDGAEAIVVSTNNRSYRRSANSAQHVAIGQMRAAETGRPVVQAGISGISAFIDANGDVHGTTDLFERTVLERTITTTSGQTPYVRYGEWVLWGSAIAVAVTILVALLRRRSDSSVDSEPVAAGPESEAESVAPEATAGRGTTVRPPAESLAPSGTPSSGDRA
jgi:apolipoprotein N-acyltransferase